MQVAISMSASLWQIHKSYSRVQRIGEVRARGRGGGCWLEADDDNDDADDEAVQLTDGELFHGLPKDSGSCCVESLYFRCSLLDFTLILRNHSNMLLKSSLIIIFIIQKLHDASALKFSLQICLYADI